MGFEKLIKDAHQEAHVCNSSVEVHDWIDWFKERLLKHCPKCKEQINGICQFACECGIKERMKDPNSLLYEGKK